MSDALKRAVRARMEATGERYTQARRAVLAHREAAPPVPTGEGERGDETSPDPEVEQDLRDNAHYGLSELGKEGPL